MLKKLDKYFLDIKPLFDKGGKFERWYPLYEATDSFLFSTTKSAPIAPHSRDAIDYKRIMITVIIALIPCTVMALWNTGYQANSALADLGAVPDGWRGAVMQIIGINPSSLISNMMHGALYFMPIYIVTVVVGSIWETLFNLLRGHEFSEAFLVTSLLLPLTLPPTIPLWQVAVGVSFGVVLAKEVFGGVGRNFMNPALSSRAFIYFAYPAQMSGDSIWTAVDGLSSATPLTAMVSSSAPNPISQIDVSWGNAFLGVMPGSMGETSTLACLFGAGLLLITGVASWRIMAAMLLGAVVHDIAVQHHGRRQSSPLLHSHSLAPGPGRFCLRPGLHGHRPGLRRPHQNRTMDVWAADRLYRHSYPGGQSRLPRGGNACHPARQCFRPAL
jgi:Na+-transporting NADH:ubiquinone oxidoreductase subunit B